MSVTKDIIATYRAPGQVVAKRLGMGTREDRALAILMAGCVLIFIAQWPRLAREAHIAEQDLNPILASQLLVWVFIMPLVFYVLALVVFWLLRLFRQNITGFNSRFALFWAVLAIAPISLFRGLIGGFVGPDLLYDIIGVIGLLAFAWFWIAGLRTAVKT